MTTRIITSIAFQVSLFKTLDTQTEVLNKLFHLYRRSYLFGQIYFKKCTALRKHVSSITQLCEKMLRNSFDNSSHMQGKFGG